ncbi:helix-turn-helix domain-containing protein [Saccharothrix luteola]|uniref:helix-turn-helix domain-containing protein n=1 Tax=Saccharothrix luteola TaxID=2893018 RepID=UPI001E588E10|nr:helix-turn-helix transcriptional regulator [Saccharothrix luteola]MCC8248491.1 helix-turn-helix domain-containing protein [Saccharothrix luteola]
MPQNQGPGVRRRVLASALTRLREEAGLDFDDVVENLGYSKSKISRIESAYTGVSIVDTRALAELYGAAPDKTAWLLRLAKVAKKRGWWHVYGDVLFDWFSEYVVLESEATAVNIFEIDLIPGLFQTPAYSYWSMRAYAPDASDEVINKRAELRQTRQRRVEDGSLSVWAIVDEAALRRAVGGREVHLEQLNHLSKVVERPNVTLQVLPFGKGQHMAMGTAFRLLKFLDFPSVVYMENLTGGLYLDEEAEVERYSLVLDHLRATALDPQESIALIRRVIGDL